MDRPLLRFFRMAYLVGGFASPMAKKGSIAVEEDKWSRVR